MKIGFLGLGSMGSGMARRLLAAGHDVVAFDPNAAALQSFADVGGVAAVSVRDVADRAEIIFASLPTIKASKAVTLGEDGIRNGKAVRLFVETSTIGPAEARQMSSSLNSAGIAYLDAPVSGGVDGARDGTLTTIVGGGERLLAEVEPIYRSMASRIIHAGSDPGAGQIFKVVNNFIVMNAISVVCQAIAVGVRAGADEQMLLDVINQSTGRNFATTTFFPNVIGPRSSALALDMAIKDVKLFADLAEEHGLPSDSANLVLQQWETASANGEGAVQWYEKMLRE